MSRNRIRNEAKYSNAWRPAVHARQVMVNDYQTYILLAREWIKLANEYREPGGNLAFYAAIKNAKGYLREGRRYRERYGFTYSPTLDTPLTYYEGFSWRDVYELRLMRK